MNNQKDAEDFLGEGTQTETSKSPVKTPPDPKKTDAKPAVRVMKGKWGGAKMPTDLPVSERLAPPITRRRHAVYKLKQFENAFDGRIDPPYNKIEPQPYELVPYYQIYDQFEADLGKRNKILTFTEGVEIVTVENPVTKRMEPVTRPKNGIPEFRNGTMVVDIEKDYLKYLWMELHPRNESSKMFNNQRKPIFRRVDLDYANPFINLATINIQIDAQNYIRKLGHSKRVNLAANLGIRTNLAPTELELELQSLCKSADGAKRVLFTDPDNTATIKLNIGQAWEEGILEYIEDNQAWMFSSDTEPLLIVLQDKDPVEDLANFLNSPKGKEAYKDILSQLEAR